MKTLSMGAGVQTTALLFEFWQEEKWDYVVFADTGSERASTYKYLEDYIKPFCKIHGIKFVTVKSDEPLEDYLRRKKRFILVYHLMKLVGFQAKKIENMKI